MDSEVDVWKVFAYIGIFYICRLAIPLLWHAFLGFRSHILSKFCQTNLVQKYGKWAVVTGCTAGIGRAYTFELAKRGMNIVLISRNVDKLRALADEIERTHNVGTKIIQADFSEGRSLYQRLATELSSVDVGILVNNVGVISEDLLYLTELKESYIWNTIYVNIGAVTMMTRILLPGMLKNRRGAIVNTSSVSGGHRTLPLLSVYSGTKAYIASLTTALQSECQGTGVTVQHLMPACVNTDMMDTSKIVRKHIGGILIPPPEVYARSALATLGVVDFSAGYWSHSFMVWSAAVLVPDWMWYKVSYWITRRLRTIQLPQAPKSMTNTATENNAIHQ